MPMKLRERAIIPAHELKTVHVLGLDIPVEGDMPLGANVELMDLGDAYNEGKVGKWEFTLRSFCFLTRRLPKRDWITYEQASELIRHPEDQAEVLKAVNELVMKPMIERLEAAREAEAERQESGDSGDSGNAPKAPRKRKSSTP